MATTKRFRDANGKLHEYGINYHGYYYVWSWSAGSYLQADTYQGLKKIFNYYLKHPRA